MEESLDDIAMLLEFAGLDAGEEVMPDQTTILKFRHLLEAHALAQTLFDDTAALLAAKALLPRQGDLASYPGYTTLTGLTQTHDILWEAILKSTIEIRRRHTSRSTPLSKRIKLFSR